MSKRSDVEKKKSTTMLSPFSDRTVNADDHLSTSEKEIYYWVVTYNPKKE